MLTIVALQSADRAACRTKKELGKKNKSCTLEVRVKRAVPLLALARLAPPLAAALPAPS
jgi:hypothetical protein